MAFCPPKNKAIRRFDLMNLLPAAFFGLCRLIERKRGGLKAPQKCSVMLSESINFICVVQRLFSPSLSWPSLAKAVLNWRAKHFVRWCSAKAINKMKKGQESLMIEVKVLWWPLHKKARGLACLTQRPTRLQRSLSSEEKEKRPFLRPP